MALLWCVFVSIKSSSYLQHEVNTFVFFFSLFKKKLVMDLMNYERVVDTTSKVMLICNRVLVGKAAGKRLRGR